MKRKPTAPILIVLFLILAVGIFWVFHRESGDVKQDDPQPTVTATPVPTATPQPTLRPTPEMEYTTPIPEPLTPSPTAVPTPTVEPTVAPTPTAPPQPSYATVGEFKSDSGAKINIIVKWGILTENGQQKLKMDVYIESYSLQIGARKDDIVFKVNDSVSYASSPSVVIEDNALHETFIGSSTVDISPDSDLNVSVRWYFNGSYSNMQIADINAAALIHSPA